MSLFAVALAACEPRETVIVEGVGGTLTAIAPTPLLPADRPTSTAVPTVLPVTPTNTTEPTATAEPTATEGPTPTHSPVPSTTGELIFEDTFDSAGLWAVGDATDSNVVVSGGVLSYTQKTPGSFSYRIIGKQAADFSAELTTTLANTCGSGDKYGILFRVQDANNTYAFQIDCEGRYRLARFVGGATTPLIDWTPSSAIERGAKSVNVLAVQATGSDLTLIINGTKVGSHNDSGFANGKFGLIVGSNVTRNFTVLFDDLRIYQLP